jgi:protein TonB
VDTTLLTLGTLNAVLALLIALVHLVPVDPPDSQPRFVDARAREVLTLDEIPQTAPGAPPPPPVVPLPPVVLPDDELLEPEPIPVPEPDLPMSPSSLNPPVPGTGSPGRSGPLRLEEVEISPQPIRVVEPEYPSEARRRRIRAEIVVRVLVDERGRVSEPVILRRLLYGRQNTPQEVDQLGYGLEEAALAAALRWLFRPAEHRGERVQTYTIITFHFGH